MSEETSAPELLGEKERTRSEFTYRNKSPAFSKCRAFPSYHQELVSGHGLSWDANFFDARIVTTLASIPQTPPQSCFWVDKTEKRVFFKRRHGSLGKVLASRVSYGVVGGVF